MPPEPPGSAATLRRAPSGWFTIGAVVLFSLNLGALWTYVERIGVAVGLSSGQTANVLSLALALSVGGALGASVLGGRLGQKFPFVCAAGAQLIGLALMTQDAGQNTFIAGAVLYSLAWAFAVPYLYLLAASQDASGRLLVLAPVAQAVGAALGPTLAASLLSGGPSYLAVNGLAASALIGAMMCVAMMRSGVLR
jgi:hypothetical protein